MSRKILQGSTASPMTSISNSPHALLPIHFTSQKLIRSKHRKGVPGIMVILMPGALLQDTPDALLVLYQTETFKTEKTVTTIWKTHLSTATIITRQNCNLLPIPGHSGTKSTEKAEKSQEKEPETSRFRPLWQGQEDSNPRPTVLETGTLPAELYPCIRRIRRVSYYITFASEKQPLFAIFLLLLFLESHVLLLGGSVPRICIITGR